MEPTSRRKFLRSTSVAVAAAGVAAPVPLTAAQAFGDTHQPIPVLYTGEREVVVTDKRLASLLYHASR